MSENSELETTPQILPDIELQKQKEEAREQYRKMIDSGKKPETMVITADNKLKGVSELNNKEIEREIITCATDPIYFIETYLTVFDQTKGDKGMIVPFKLFDFQKHLIESYLNNDFNIANKYRQAGISTTTCAFLSWYIMFNKNRSVAIIADKIMTAQDELMSDVVNFIDGCPDWLRPKPTVKNTQKLKRYDNGSEIGAFAAKSGLRGYTPTLLFWDETAWTEKGDKFWESAGPTLQTGGAAIFVSCVTKDSFIFTDRGIKQVKEYINSNELGGHIIDNIQILGKDKTRKSNILFNNGCVKTYKTITKYSELETSGNHRYWSYNKENDSYNWVKAKNLKVGDYIAIQYGMDLWGDNDYCSDFNPFVSNKIKNVFNPKKITKDIAYFIGLYISEGYIRKSTGNRHGGQIVITCGDDISNIYEKLNIPYKCEDGLHYITNSYNLLEFFEYLGFDITKKAPEKTIPSRVLEMGRDNIISMIQGIMDGDGWSSYNPKENKLRVGIGLSSLELIKQLRIIFNNFGILTEYKEYTTPKTELVNVKSTQHRLIANSIYAKKYFDEINFKFKRKSIVIDKYKPEILKNDGVQDNIPNGSKILKENIVWVKIKDIVEGENETYDFSMSNDNEVENNEFHMSIIYNSVLTHNTPNGFDSVFYKTYNLATQKKNAFKSVELFWFNDPRYNKNLKWYKNRGKSDEIVIDDVDFDNKKRIDLNNDGWEPYNEWMGNQIKRVNGDMRKINQELLGKFLGSGDNFIAGEYLKRIEEKEVKIPIRQEYTDSNMWIWEDPIPTEEYIIGVDVSSGHSDDYSSINIMKKKEYIENSTIKKNGVDVKVKLKKNILEQVAEYYGKISPQGLAEIVYLYATKYNNGYVVIDITGGHGGQTVNKLFEFGYINLHYSEITHKPSRDMLSGYIKKGKKTLSDGSVIFVDLVPGFYIGNNRGQVLLEFQRAIHLEDLIIRSSRASNELKTFLNASGSRVADHGRSFHDDSIIGIAIATFTANYDMKKFNIDDNSTRNMIDTMLNVNNNDKRKKYDKKNQSMFDNYKPNPYGSNAWLFYGIKK